MKLTLIEDGGLFEADAQATEVLQLTNGLFHSPSASKAAQRSSVLRDMLSLSIAPARSNHLDLAFGHFFVHSIAVLRSITDDPLRCCLGQHEVKQPLDHAALVWRGRTGRHRHAQALGICPHLSFYALSGFQGPDAIAFTPRLRKGAVGKTLVELEAVAPFQAPPGAPHDALKHAPLCPFLEPTLNDALRAEFSWEVFQFRPIDQYPNKSAKRRSVVCLRSSAPLTSKSIRNMTAKPI